jgi:hypothetical protein
MGKQMWSDEDIVNAIADVRLSLAGKRQPGMVDAYALMKRMRDDMQGRIDEMETELYELREAHAVLLGHAQTAWEYDGPATIQVYGGGYIAIRFNAAEFPQGAPESGHWDIQIALKNKSEVEYE